MSECPAYDEIDRLREELLSCSNAKDAQINNMSHRINGMHGDLMRIDGDIRTLTKAVTDISNALHTIADNTTKITEVLELYQNIKGFTFIVRHASKILIGVAAIAAALIYLNGLQLHIGA